MNKKQQDQTGENGQEQTEVYPALPDRAGLIEDTVNYVNRCRIDIFDLHNSNPVKPAASVFPPEMVMSRNNICRRRTAGAG